MTFEEFKTEFLATLNLDEYKKKDSYIHEMFETGRLAAVATSINGKYIHSVLNDLSVQDVSLE